MFLIFENEELAQAACDRIFNNIRNWLMVNLPIRVRPEGLTSLNFDGTPNLKAAPTTKWAEPLKCEEGWAIPKPEQKDVGQVPIAIVLEGVGGEEVETIKPVALENPGAP